MGNVTMKNIIDSPTRLRKTVGKKSFTVNKGSISKSLTKKLNSFNEKEQGYEPIITNFNE